MNNSKKSEKKESSGQLRRSSKGIFITPPILLLPHIYIPIGSGRRRKPTKGQILLPPPTISRFFLEGPRAEADKMVPAGHSTEVALSPPPLAASLASHTRRHVSSPTLEEPSSISASLSATSGDTRHPEATNMQLVRPEQNSSTSTAPAGPNADDCPLAHTAGASPPPSMVSYSGDPLPQGRPHKMVARPTLGLQESCMVPTYALKAQAPPTVEH